MKAILCFGDSITFGRGENLNIGWCGRLKNYFDAKDEYNCVYNLGVPGHTSTDLLERFDSEAKGRIRIKRDSDEFSVIIGIGTNDCKWDGMPKNNKPRMSQIQFRKNIQKLIQKATKFKVNLFFLGLFPIDEEKTLPYEETSFENKRVKLFNNIIMEECKKENIPFLSLFDLFIHQNYQNLLADGLHPNSKGYELIFKEIKKNLIKNKIIKKIK